MVKNGFLAKEFVKTRISAMEWFTIRQKLLCKNFQGAGICEEAHILMQLGFGENLFEVFF